MRRVQAAAPPAASHYPYDRTSSSGSRSRPQTDTRSTHTSRGTSGLPPSPGAACGTSRRRSSTRSRSGRKFHWFWARGPFWAASAGGGRHSPCACTTCRTCVVRWSSLRHRFKTCRVDGVLVSRRWRAGGVERTSSRRVGGVRSVGRRQKSLWTVVTYWHIGISCFLPLGMVIQLLVCSNSSSSCFKPRGSPAPALPARLPK